MRPLPDAVMLDFGEAIFATETELKAIDPVVEILFTRFRITHLALKARLLTRHDRQAEIRPLRTMRNTCHQRLVHAMGKIWDGLDTVGTDWANPRSKEQVQLWRAELFRYGKPTAKLPGSVKLIEMGDAITSFLAGGSPLARAWPAEEVAELRAALAEYTAAARSVRSSVVSKVVSVADLNQDRTKWMVDFYSLRDLTLNLTAGRADAGFWKTLFADNRPGRPAKQVAEPGSGGPEQPPDPTGP